MGRLAAVSSVMRTLCLSVRSASRDTAGVRVAISTVLIGMASLQPMMKET